MIKQQSASFSSGKSYQASGGIGGTGQAGGQSSSLSSAELYPSHYLSLWRRDMRLLQKKRKAVGLSSLGRMESNVSAQLSAITNLLCLHIGQEINRRNMFADSKGDGCDIA